MTPPPEPSADSNANPLSSLKPLDNPPTSLSGSCICNLISYTTTSPPLFTSLCYCTDCTRITSSTHVTILAVPASAFHLTPSSHAHLKTVTLKSDAGRDKHVNFCKECGCVVFGGKLDGSGFGGSAGGIVTVATGTLEDGGRGWYRPQVRMFVRNRPGWDERGVGEEGEVQFEGAPDWQ